MRTRPTSYLFFAALWLVAISRVALSQCEPAWHGFGGYPGVNGDVYAQEVWDVAGVGPARPVLAFGGSFMLIGDLTVRSIAFWDYEAGGWLEPRDGVNGTVHAFGLLPNAQGGDDLIVGGDFDPSTSQPGRNVVLWDGVAWSAIGAGLQGRIQDLHVLPTDGPSTEIVAAGHFIIGDQAANLARWDGASWSAIPGIFNGTILTVDSLPAPEGARDIVVGGTFTEVDGAPVSRVARRNGIAWSGLGAGLNGTVARLLELPTGELVAAGTFDASGAIPVTSVARWDGLGWSSLGAGIDGDVWDLRLASTNGPGFELVAGGSFLSAGGIAAEYLARWDGTQWQPMAQGLSASVSHVAVLPRENAAAPLRVVANGWFRSAGGSAALELAYWDGAGWNPVATGFDSTVFAVSFVETGPLSGQVLVGGSFDSAGGQVVNRIARWDGANWFPLGSGIQGIVFAIAPLRNGDVVVSGYFSSAGGNPANNIARWNGSAWTSLGAGLSYMCKAVIEMPNGDIVASGGFGMAGGVRVNGIARWDGATWSPLGDCISGADDSALALLASGDLVASGSFRSASGQTIAGLGRWDGTNWNSLGWGSHGAPQALLVVPNGNGGEDIVAGGQFIIGSVLRFDGNTWTALGNSSATIESLARLPSGDILAGGNFISMNGVQARGLARWSNGGWHAFEGFGGAAYALAASHRTRDEFFAGGSFTAGAEPTARYLAHWTSPCRCTADLDDGTGSGQSDGAVTIDDLLFFLVGFENGSAAVDLDNDGDPATGTPDGAVTIDDLLFFLARFEAGC